MPSFHCPACGSHVQVNGSPDYVWCSCGQPIDGAQHTLGVAERESRHSDDAVTDVRDPLVANLGARLSA